MTNKNLEVKEVMTKEQEITLMYDLYQALPQDSYLKEILRGLPEYCEEQIKNDWTINPLQTIKEQEEKIEMLKTHTTQRERILIEIEKDRDNWQERCQEWHNKYNQQQQIAEELREEKLEADTKIEKLELEIQKLKAKLYDYMTGIR